MHTIEGAKINLFLQ